MSIECVHHPLVITALQMWRRFTAVVVVRRELLSCLLRWRSGGGNADLRRLDGRSGLQGLRLIPLGRLDNPLAGSRNCECERARLDGENWTDG